MSAHISFVKVNKVCDYIPAISTVSNLTGLFQKCLVLPLMSSEAIVNSHYYRHLKNKSFLRCIVLLIPVIGNIVVGIYDFANRKYNDKTFMLDAIKSNHWMLEYASEELKNDSEFVLAAFKVSDYSLVLDYATKQLRGDKNFILAAFQQHPSALFYASEELRGDKAFVLELVQKDGLALGADISEKLKRDKDIVRAAVQQNPSALFYASEELKRDKAFVLELVQKDGLALEYASKELQGDPEVAFAAGMQNRWALFYASQQFKRDNIVIQIVNTTQSSSCWMRLKTWLGS